MGTTRRTVAAVLVLVVVAGSCGSKLGADGLPAHCDRMDAFVVATAEPGDDAPPVALDQAIQAAIAQELPRLRVAFSWSQAQDRSEGSDQVHVLHVTDTPTTANARLTNDNGVELLAVDASAQDGSWAVDRLEICASMKDEFGPSH